MRRWTRPDERSSTWRTVIRLEIWEPDFPAAGHISAAAVEALRAGQTHCPPAPGIPARRESVATFPELTGRMRVGPGRVVVTSAPGRRLMLFTILALAGQGDEGPYPDTGCPKYESITACPGP